PEAVELGLDSALDDLVYQGHNHNDLPALGGGKWKVLLAEDNPVLQQLAERQLRKFGLDVAIVSNGQEAVSEFKKQNMNSEVRFDAIFMDCQMPEMDGYEATVEIRRLEESAGVRVPIVAMTAGAMPSDRERCIRSGMDDYLSKPVGHEQLRRVIASWIPAALNAINSETMPQTEHPAMSTEETPPSGAKSGDDGKESPPINISELRKLYGDDDLHDILKMFLTEATELLASVRTQIDSRSDRELAATAHQLKGLSAVLCADNLTRLSLEIEQCAKKSAWEPAEGSLGLLQDEFSKVRAFVNDFLKSA
ncbi:MAG TPA: response regulator, partial [Candidatus Melainabacteria bacterium]|nr:response regulator [Candidatus Melainabacteria bacterium]